MLVERKIKELAEQKEYVKVFNYFHDEYTEMMKNFLMRHEVKLNEDDCLIHFQLQMQCMMKIYQKELNMIYLWIAILL